MNKMSNRKHVSCRCEPAAPTQNFRLYSFARPPSSYEATTTACTCASTHPGGDSPLRAVAVGRPPPPQALSVAALAVDGRAH